MLLGAGLAHRLSTGDGLVLARGRLRAAIGVEVRLRERFWMVQMRVERQGQGGPFLDETNTGMAVPVDAALVPLGQTEPAFQAQIVLGQLRIGSDKQTGLETGHHLGHLLVDRILFCSESLLQFLELLLPLNRGAVLGIERAGDSLDFADVPAHRLLRVTNRGQPAFDTAG